jgi:hypothetical protein
MVNRRPEEFERAWPRNPLLRRKHGYQSTQNGCIIDGEDALQKYDLDDYINSTQIKLHLFSIIISLSITLVGNLSKLLFISEMEEPRSALLAYRRIWEKRWHLAPHN